MNPHENLDRLFEQARNVDPLFELDEVKQLITEPKPINKLRPKANHLIKNWFVGTLSILVICGAVYFIFPKDEVPQKVAEQKTILIESVTENSDQSAQLIEETSLIIPSEKKIAVKKSEDSENLKIKNSPETNTEVASIYPNTSIGNYPKRVDEEKASNDGYLLLTNKELVNLGIITDGNKLYYKNIADLDSMILDNMTTGEKTGYKEMLPTFELKIPVSGGRSITISSYPKDSDLTKFKKFWPDVIEIKDQYDFIAVTNKNTPHNYYREFGLEVKKMLIPVLVTLYHPLGISSRYDTLIFYFKPSVSFFNALPVDLLSSAESIAKSYSNSSYNNLVNFYIHKNKTKTDSFNLAVKSIPNLSIRQIILTKEELKKLNIVFDGKMLVYKNKFSIDHQKIKLEIRNGGIPSVSIDKHYRFFKTQKPKVFPYCTSDTLLNYASFFYKIDEEKPTPYVQLRDQFLAMIDSVVPIRIKYNSGYTQLFWFPKNEAFLNKLGKQNQGKILGSNDDDDLVKYKNRKINTSSLKLIELNNDELSGLGILVSNEGVSVPTAIKKGKSYYTTYSKRGTLLGNINLVGDGSEVKRSGASLNFKATSIEFRFVDSVPHKMQFIPTNKVDKTFIEPTLVTDDLGNYWRSYKVENELTREEIDYLSKNHLSPFANERFRKTDSISEFKLISRIRTMIPVLVRTGDTYTVEDKLNHRWRPDIILWYEPTDSFFASLPKNLADEIKAEYMAIKANQPTPGCKYFEVCQSVKGMINDYAAYPNPATDELNVMVDLAEERKLTISLTEITGKEVKNFVSNAIQQKGKKEYPFHIGDLNDGMYILRVESDKDESVTQRIIKK